MIVVDIINLSSSANTLLRERVIAMRQKGIDNRIVCIDGPYVAPLREAGIPVEVIDLPRGLDPVRLIRSTMQIASYLRRQRVDVVHTHCSVPGAVGRVAAWLARVPVVIHTVHGFHFQEDMPALIKWPSLLAEKALGLLTDTLLTQNKGDLALAERHGIGPPGRRTWIGNGIDLERFRPIARGPDGAAARSRLPVVICVARFEPVKNHALLFEVVELLRERGHDFVLRLVGSGQLEETLRTRARAAGMADRVEFLGYREDMPELLADADIAVLTSFKEGMPRAVLEAMAMGLPVIGTRVPGTREAIRDGETGYAICPDDTAGLVAALERLLVQPELRERMGARGREVALSDFDERPIVESLRNLYFNRLRRRVPARATHAPGARSERTGSTSRTGR